MLINGGRMFLERISVINYKNIGQAELAFSSKINCFVGCNGAGKSNLLDAVYYLSFCKSASNPIDSQNIRHGQDFFMLQGFYKRETDEKDEVSCGLRRNRRKSFKRNKKEYRRLSEHIGLIPLVLVTPDDSCLITDGSSFRRRFIDMAIVQYDHEYLEALTRYNKALQQRNAMLKEAEGDEDLMDVMEEIMAREGKEIFQQRAAFVEAFTPVFEEYYGEISGDREHVGLTYVSDALHGDLLQAMRENRQKDRIVGFSLKGIHKDDLEMTLGGFPIRHEGSQGQNKTYVIAMKLAQWDFLRHTGNGTKPLLLLDDIFDKLDTTRVEQIVKIVAGEKFGQIFITDTHRARQDNILGKTDNQYMLFNVEEGEIKP